MFSVNIVTTFSPARWKHVRIRLELLQGDTELLTVTIDRVENNQITTALKGLAEVDLDLLFYYATSHMGTVYFTLSPEFEKFQYNMDTPLSFLRYIHQLLAPLFKKGHGAVDIGLLK